MSLPQVILQPQSPLTNPGRLTKKHKADEEEVIFNYNQFDYGDTALKGANDNRKFYDGDKDYNADYDHLVAAGG